MKILIGVPVGHFILPWRFSYSLSKAALYLQKQGIETDILMSEASYIEDNKNTIFQTASKYDCDYLVMLDWDHVFQPEDIHRLFLTASQNNLDLCSGLYFVDKGYIAPCIMKGNVFYADYPKDFLFEVTTFASGFSIISRAVLKELIDKPFTRIEVDGTKLGEDISFCRRASLANFKVWCDSRIKIGHLRFKTLDETSAIYWASEKFQL